MREARAVVIACGGEEYLRLVLQPAKRLAVDDAIAIVLERRPHIVLWFGPQATARVAALGGLRREHLPLPLLQRFTDGGQQSPPGSWCRAPGVRRRNWRQSSDRGRRTCFVCRGRRQRGRSDP